MTKNHHGHYPTLGFDPTPGNVSAAGEVARTTRRTADALGQVADVLTGSSKGEWRGKAAIAFRDLLDDDFRPRVVKAAHAFDAAARALSHWVDTMEGYQRRTRELEERARQAEQRARHAHDRLMAITVPAATPDDDEAATRRREQAQDEQRSWREAARTADGELAEAKRQAHTLEHEYTGAGRTVASQLQKAMDVAPNEPGFWDRLGDHISGALDAIGDAVHDLGDVITDVLHEVAPLLKVIGDVAGMASTVLGLLAFVPGLQFLAGPALALGAVALVSHYLSAVGTSGSFLDALTDRDVILDAIGVACGLGALKFGPKLLASVKAGGQPFRVVPQLIGPPMEIPLNLFQAGTRVGYAMSTAEVGYRYINLKIFQTGMIATALGGPDNVRTVRNLVTGDWGPMFAPRPAVTR